MLTIGQLATYAGVTVRAVRHYHAKDLLGEPGRDGSGYRRYDASAVVEVIRIKTLAEAGVPLSKVHQLLGASSDEFSAAIQEIDDRLRHEIRRLERHRERVAVLPTADRLALPPEAAEYLDRLRDLGVPERAVVMERDAWILVAAQIPAQMPSLMAIKRSQIENPDVLDFYFDLVQAVDWSPDDPRLPEIADRLVALIEADVADGNDAQLDDFDLDPDLVALLDEVFVTSLPVAPRLLELLQERGWAGWTKLERIC